MQSGKEKDAPAATEASQSETVENRQTQTNYTILETALAYAKRGWYIFPCHEEPGAAYLDKQGQPVIPQEKSPYVASGLHAASNDLEKVRNWWTKWPTALIGVNCGKSGLFVVDLDVKHDKDGITTFASLGITDTDALHSSTPSGGRHIIFSGQGKNTAGSHGIDTRGKGGYFIAPPSEILSGENPGKYLALDDWDRVPGPISAGLFEMIQKCQKTGKPARSGMAKQPSSARLSRMTVDFIEHGASSGERNEKLFRAACDLAGCGFSRTEAESMLLPTTERIGTPKAEALATIESAYSRKRTAASFVKSQVELVCTPFEPESDGDLQSPYRVIDGSFCSFSLDRDGTPVTKRLANWNAKIIQEVARDDGQDVVRKLVIAGFLANGNRLPACEVDVATFVSMNWVLQYWGSRAIITAGQSTKDKLREAIQWASPDAKNSTVYTHTGWRVLDGQRVYLSSSGALGVEGVTVSLDGNLKRYAIPVNTKNEQEAMQASLRFLQVAPLSATFPLWGCMFLAPLAEITPFDFVPWVFGETGCMKSTLCALALCHYGDFDHKNLPEGWASTDNILEKHTFVIKDAPLVIDDFAPQASGVDAQAHDRRAARLVRSIGNHSSRNRMNADTSTRAGFMARGLVISTGEQLPTGQSVLARILPLEILPRSVDVEKITQAQISDAPLYPHAMSGYLSWLVRNWEEIASSYGNWHRELRDTLRGGFHLRTPEMFAHVLLGIRLGLTYAVEVNAISNTEGTAMFEHAKLELVQLAQSQNSHVRDELPAIKFIQAIKALVSKGDYYIDGLQQPHPENAKWLGWVDDDFYYLQSEITFNAVSDFFRKEGSVLGLKQKALNAQLVEKGYIMRGDKNTYAAYHKEKGTLRTYAFFRTKFDIE